MLRPEHGCVVSLSDRAVDESLQLQALADTASLKSKGSNHTKSAWVSESSVKHEAGEKGRSSPGK